MPDDSGFAIPAGGEPRGPTYYGQPQLKPSPFGWKVSLYIWLAGLSGSSQLLATVRRPVRRRVGRAAWCGAAVIWQWLARFSGRSC